MTLHLPPPSDPPDRPERFVGRGPDLCQHCAHEWHGLVCRIAACYCLGSHLPEYRSARTLDPAIRDEAIKRLSRGLALPDEVLGGTDE